MPGAKIAPLVPRRLRGQFFFSCILLPLDKSNEKGTTYIVIKSNWRRSYISINSVDLPFEILKNVSAIRYDVVSIASRMKGRGVLVGNFEQHPQLIDTKLLFCGRALKLFSPLKSYAES